ncbi:MAG TPA: ATP-dependent DNA helicase [Candidatus Limnocylindrales bacterium]
MTSPRPHPFEAAPDVGDSSPIDLDIVADLLRGLDRQQRAAVTHGDRPLLVLAGPGTGKTHVVTRRIAWLIATKRARPEEILALTFTERAADEMQARVDLLVPYGQAGTAIMTFHAFGDRLVRDHALELGLPGEPRVLGHAEASVLLGGAIDRLPLAHYRPLADPTRHVSALVDLFGRAKDEGAMPADFRRLADAVEPHRSDRRRGADDDVVAAATERAARLRELAAAYEAYQALLIEAGAVDHGDQLAMAVRLLRDHPSIRVAVRGRYRYVLVDEFQDTNPCQLDLLELLARGGRALTVVGDDDQAIYAFRGAAVENLLGFESRFPGTRTIALRRNHRSRRSIVDASRRLIRHNDPHRLEARADVDRSPVVVRRARSRPVEARTFTGVGDEGDWVAAEVRRRIDAGQRADDIAILVRTNSDAAPVLASLDMAGVAWRFSGRAGFYARPAVRELMAFLRFVAAPDSSSDCYAVVAGEPYGLGGAGLSAVVERSRRRRTSLWATIEEVFEQPGLVRLAADDRRTLERFVAELRAAIEASHRTSAGQLLYDHLRRSGRLRQLVGAAETGDAALDDAARFFGLVRSAGLLVRDDRLAIVVGHLDALATTTEPDDPGEADDASVAVLTVHKAKGLEFGTVFVVGLADGRFPGRGRREAIELPVELRRSGVGPSDETLHAEERRLAYVAMTRARDELVLTFATTSERGRTRRPSAFIAEALDQATPLIGTPSVATALLATPAANPAPMPAERSVGEADPSTLSYSALDTYLRCPASYRYRHVLRVPEPAHHALEVGSAMHQAVAAFNVSRMKGRPLDDAGIVAALDAHWSGEGFHSRDHEDARYAAAREALIAFRAADLADGRPAAASVEARFSVAIEGVRINGRYDRVDEEEDGVVITDYKASDVADPARARQRARSSLQLAIYALAHEVTDGTLPSALQLHFLGSGVVARVPVDARRLVAARASIRAGAEGIAAGDFSPRPDPMACRDCPFRRICPAAAA